ncbi:DNA internalization-related competence protein ComEC/Rec2 [Xanthomonadaceae bacterium XH05]|nr:DNA internalization-related competence protein ComEC/Rec2 [Xanthomonadaceae bacterium XH05]
MAPRCDLLFASGLTLGVVAAMGLPQAVPGWVCWSLVATGIFVVLRLPRWRLLSGLCIGSGWAVLVAVWTMDARLPVALEGDDLIVEGRVRGLPESGDGRVRFEFDVARGENAAMVLEGRRLRLAWYRSEVVPAPGSEWRLAVRLKRPRGTLNPGGFDYERHALEKRIAATGYVRDGSGNTMLSPGGGIDALRLRLSDTIATAVDAPRARFVQALAVGDVRGLDGDDWHVLRATGIAHLIAISGLHVGLVAGFGALLMRGLYRLRPRLGLRVPLPQAAAIAALLAASGYTALAGFALPTVRTLLMIAAALMAVLLRRAFDPVQAFALALIVVLLADPLAVLNAGFWLSFLGVAWLLWCLPRAMDTVWWRTLVSAQGVMTLGLLPLTVWFFGQASVAGPVCNLVAVPWVSFVVVPVALVATLLELLWAGAGGWAFQLSGWLMQGLWAGLEPIASLHGALVYLPEPSLAALVLALLGAFWLLLPRGFPGKPLALLLFAPLLFPAQEKPPAGSVDLTVLDVGQGLAVLLRTADHAVLVDAGPAFPGGLDMGDAAVVPALRGLGVARLDLLVVSHDDNDHAGGVAAVKRAYSPVETVAARARPEPGERACETGKAWGFDGLRFHLLHPPEHFPYLRNDSSCVLRVAADGTGLALLPGDIGAIIEQRLRREQRDDLAAHVLVVPHHGSRTSSAEDFIDAVSPKLALVGAGHRNRFDLPRDDVLARYRERDIELANTAATGAIHVRIDAKGVVGAPRHERALRRALWREP